jgi:hypothetical protein
MAWYPLIGYLAWAALFGGVTSVPALSDVFSVIMRYQLGR